MDSQGHSHQNYKNARPSYANLYRAEPSPMKNSVFTFSLLCLVALTGSASAGIITFEFEGPAGADLNAGVGFTSVTAGGITLTLTATANTGEFNLTGTGFGTNADGFDDDTDAFDSENGPEAITFTISSSVALTDLTLVSFDFDRFGNSADDVGTVTRNGLSLGGFTSGEFVDSDLTTADVLTLNETGIIDTDTFVLSNSGTPDGGATQGFGLEAITFNATAAAVPEPGVFGLLLAGLGFSVVRSRRQNRNTAATK